MQNNNSNSWKEETSVILHAHRKGNIFKMKINWKIDCFSFQQHLTKSFNSPTIRLPGAVEGPMDQQGEVDGEWYLVMIPMVKSKRETEDREREFVSLHLRRDSSKEVDVPTRFFLRILNEKNEVAYHRDCAKPVLFSGKGSGSVMWGWDRYVSHEELFEQSPHRRGFLIADSVEPQAPRDSLFIQAEIHCLIGFKNENFYRHTAPIVNTLELDLRGVFERKELTDFVLVSSDGVEIPAHRVILDARSEVFRAMFFHDTKEKAQGRIVVDDLDAETLMGMLEFMYSNSATSMARLVKKLLVATDKYAVKGLKQACELHLVQTMSFDNAGQLAYLADMHDARYLQEELKLFVNTNYRACIGLCSQEHLQYLTGLLDPLLMVSVPLPATARKIPLTIAKPDHGGNKTGGQA